MQHSELHDGKQTKQFQRLVHRLTIGHTSITIGKTISHSPTWRSHIPSLNPLNRNEHCKGASKKNHPKWSQLDQEARKTLPMSKAANAALKDQKFDGLEKVCKHLLKTFLWKRYDTLSALTKPRQRTIRKISSLIEYGRARFCHTYRHSPYFDQATKVKISSNQTLPLFKTVF